MIRERVSLEQQLKRVQIKKKKCTLVIKTYKKKFQKMKVTVYNLKFIFMKNL